MVKFEFGGNSQLLTEFWPFFDLGLGLCKGYIDIFGKINFTFLQNYYILQLVTISHDYPVPVVKHNCD